MHICNYPSRPLPDQVSRYDRGLVSLPDCAKLNFLNGIILRSTYHIVVSSQKVKKLKHYITFTIFLNFSFRQAASASDIRTCPSIQTETKLENTLNTDNKRRDRAGICEMETENLIVNSIMLRYSNIFLNGLSKQISFCFKMVQLKKGVLVL